MLEIGDVTTQIEPYLPGADTCDDLRERARQVLPEGVFIHTIGGAGEERTMAANRAGYGRYRLLPRVLTDVSNIDTSVEILGTKLAAPIFTSPTGGIGLVHPDGERGVARAAANSGVGFILNGHPSVTMEDAAAAAGPARWNQLYWQGNRDIMADLAQRAEAAGYTAIVLTVDNAMRPRRPRMIRSGFKFPVELSAPNFERYTGPDWQDRVAFDERGRPVKGGGSDVILTWSNVEWLRSLIKVPFVLKGIRSPFDAIRAADAGADGIMISNHGGRNLDGEPGTIEVLEDIVAAVGDRMTVIIDGGIRRATDIAVALGLGAKAVGLGAPVVWALASGGEETVTDFLDDMVQDLARTFGLIGVSRVSELTRAHVSQKDEYAPDWALTSFLPPAYR